MSQVLFTVVGAFYHLSDTVLIDPLAQMKKQVQRGEITF